MSFTVSFFALAKENTLRVCTTGDYKPIIYQLPNGKYTGVDVEILEQFSKIENLNLSYVVLAYKALIPALITKKCDIIATGMAATDERKKVIDFSKDIYEARSFMIYNKNNSYLREIKKLSDFNNSKLTVGIPTGSMYETSLEKNNFIPQVKINKFESESDVSLALLTQKIDFTINGSQFLITLLKAAPHKFSYFPVKISKGNIAFGMRKEDSLLKEKINKYLDKMNGNGDHERLLDKYGVYKLPE